jgi:hypothetical protein
MRLFGKFYHLVPQLKIKHIRAKLFYTKTFVHHLGIIGINIMNMTLIIRLRQALRVR